MFSNLPFVTRFVVARKVFLRFLRYYAFSMHSTMLAGGKFVLHFARWLEGALCTGFEKLVMDADRLGSYQKILGQGLMSLTKP